MKTSAGFTQVVSAIIALGAIVIAVFFIFLLSRGLRGPREVPNPNVIPIPGTPTAKESTSEALPTPPVADPVVLPIVEDTAAPVTPTEPKKETTKPTQPFNEKAL